MRFKSNRSAGFTLAEVVVGVLLLGLTASLLGRAISDSLRAFEQNHRGDAYAYPMKRVRDEILLSTSRAQIEEGGELEIQVTTNTPREGETQETNTINARWEAEIHSTRIINLYQVDFSVNFDGGENEARKIDSQIIAFRTTWADPEEMEQLLEAKEEEFRERQSARGESEEGENI
ncbi:hypothetical protein QEH59_04655 [Coraliomargarita sp. SDUM461004]|uniref:Prepilin-type N-terminal cleavage/methylation domain-containing protein n=1 Tax=Thalassobacterium sedimentorum TaxID=3041258 RepID=A0ABU1AFU6_9BACT|nr:hypothetical protein [Coraliomargarita sp. SDUM461004]MDQ8193700.1 hypothetical protein [Coraliomargarita sp. SDUM461004]